MKRWIALALCLAMLLGVGAWADSVKLGVEGFGLFEDGAAVMNLSGLRVELTAGMNDDQDVGLRLLCETDEMQLADLALILGERDIVLSLGNGGDSGEIYRLDIDALSEQTASANDAELTALVDDLTQGWNQLAQTVSDLGQFLGDGSHGENAQGSSALDLLALLPEEWKRDGGSVDYEGVQCQATLFEIPEADVMAALRDFAGQLDGEAELQQMLSALGVDKSFVAMLDDANLSIQVSGGVYLGEAENFLEIAVDVTAQENETLRLSAVVEDRPLDDGEEFVIHLTSDDGTQSHGVDATINFVRTDDNWMALDEAGAVDLMEALIDDPDGAMAKLEAGMQGIATSVMLGAMNVLSNNQLSAISQP